MKSHPAGKVFLVGAGPGDPGLITKRGYDLLLRADVIVMDDLANPMVIPPMSRARIIPVGRAGHSSPPAACRRMSQSSINRLLIRLSKKYNCVVRLKGGDPLVFARGGEEADALRRKRIPFEIVPGVTSAVAASAYAGIPLSDRRRASSVTFVTGHASLETDGSLSRVDWSALSPVGTLAVYMGVGQWPFIREKLLENRWAGSLPVAAVEWATTRHQRVVRSTLSASAKDFKTARLSPPAIIVVGRAAGVGSTLAWVEKEKPLLGQTVAVTRPDQQSSEMKRRLEDLGAIVVPCPAIKIIPLTADPETRRAVEEIRRKPSAFDWILFLSENAVRTFTSLIGERSPSSSVFAVGPQTAQAAEECGWNVRGTAQEFSRWGVLKTLRVRKGQRILIPRAQGAPADVVERLRAKGARVDVIETYRTVPADAPPPRVKAWLLNGVDAVTFTSRSTVDHFARFFTAQERKKIFNRATLVSIGSGTTQAVKEWGGRRVVQSKEATAASMVETLVALARDSGSKRIRSRR